MTRAVLTDTGPLYAANGERDARHPRAMGKWKELPRSAGSADHSIPPCSRLILCSCRFGSRAALEWLLEVGDAPFVNPMPADYGSAYPIVGSPADQPLTLVDAILAAMAIRLGAEVGTFDQHLDLMRVPMWR